MRTANTQAMAEAAAAAAEEAALQVAEIQKNDRIATLTARMAAAKAARCAQEAKTCVAYARKFAKGAADQDAIALAEESAEAAKKYAVIAAEKAKWRSNPSNASAQSLLSQEQRFEDEIDAIESAWDEGDIDALVQLGALSPYIARHLKADMRS
jgi:hypothetical protein